MVRDMMFNATFNNISVILAVSLIGGRYRSTWRKPPTCRKTQVTDKLYHIMLHRIHLSWTGFELTTLVVIGTVCICSYQSNYYTIMTTTVQISVKCKWDTHTFVNDILLKSNIKINLREQFQQTWQETL